MRRSPDYVEKKAENFKAEREGLNSVIVIRVRDHTVDPTLAA